MVAPSSAVLLLVSTASAAHVFYSAIGGVDGPAVAFDDVSIKLVWGQHNEVGDVFASCEFFFENGQLGYMGGQRHADGSHSVIFSIWDACKRYGSTTCIVKNATALPTGQCERFGGEGHGAHCGGPITFTSGQPYDFKVAVGEANATGRHVYASPAQQEGSGAPLPCLMTHLRRAAGVPPSTARPSARSSC